MKSRQIAYFDHKVKTTERSILFAYIDDIPMKRKDCQFIKDVIDGMQYKELADKYNLSVSRIGNGKGKSVII